MILFTLILLESETRLRRETLSGREEQGTAPLRQLQCEWSLGGTLIHRVIVCEKEW